MKGGIEIAAGTSVTMKRSGKLLLITLVTTMSTTVMAKPVCVST